MTAAPAIIVDPAETIRADIRALAYRLQRVTGDMAAWRYLYEVADDLVSIATREGRLGTVDSRRARG